MLSAKSYQLSAQTTKNPPDASLTRRNVPRVSLC
jgi:hypothetical protein